MADRTDFRKLFQKTKHQLEQNISLLEADITTIKNIAIRLTKERDDARRHIEKRLGDVKALLDNFVDKLVTSLETEFATSMSVIHTKKQELEYKLSTCKNDVEKCTNVHGKVKSAVIVSENKVNQMVYASIESGQYVNDMEDVKCLRYNSSELDIDEATAMDIIGTLEEVPDLLQSSTTIEQVGSVQCPPFEVTSIAHDAQTGSWYVCFGAMHDIVCFSKDGVHVKTVTVTFKIDDMIVSPINGVIFATTPDGHDVTSITPVTNEREVRTFVLIKNSLYLHGLTWCIDNSVFAVCATDTPNYSDKPPTTVTIIEYSVKGIERKIIQVVGYTGKVYRIAQNTDKCYVLTFPKDGCLVCVDDSGSIVASLCNSSDNDILHGTASYSSVTQSNPSGTPFYPSGVCCNSQGNIFVTDWMGKRVLVLDRFCGTLRCIGEDYKCPNAICVDHNNSCDLWIGDKGQIYIWRT